MGASTSWNPQGLLFFKPIVHITQLRVTDIIEIRSLRNVKGYASSEHSCCYTKSLKSCFWAKQPFVKHRPCIPTAVLGNCLSSFVLCGCLVYVRWINILGFGIVYWIVTRSGRTVWGSNTGRGKIFSPPKCPDLLWVQPSPISMGTGVLSWD